MKQFYFLSFVIFIYLLVLQPSIVECRHRSQRIVIHGHEWTVPNEPGWDNVLREAEAVRRRLLSNCASSRECRLAAEKLREVFLKHPISAKYYDDSIGSDFPRMEGTSIFKWG
ncbi:unnamed protein product [Adineta steineri]|uniref:Uncharacterized protein n=1 Tax=Adineta steineri TaxID=433720 RepID=A0A818YT86_9BILA|nr:unnamed protein product [Adineta steineri]CAF1376129.1 unnamed protein product [Adineta steineri]CAF1379061.1 unnamed protein product [Adineta steineri]CAF1412802.1 unnamed protein product [Adineta steineri]CAF1605761.1 unnamed protein product [Adineta steineri]